MSLQDKGFLICSLVGIIWDVSQEIGSKFRDNNENIVYLNFALNTYRRYFSNSVSSFFTSSPVFYFFFFILKFCLLLIASNVIFVV